MAAIHDLSGFEKCSLTVALPILSAAGIETSALLADLLNDFNLKDWAGIAVGFTASRILKTFETKTDYRFGVNFKQSLPQFLKELKRV